MGNFYHNYPMSNDWGKKNPKWDLNVEIVALLRVGQGWRQAMLGSGDVLGGGDMSSEI